MGADDGPEPTLTDVATAADALLEAKDVLVVPGYGAAVAAAQYPLAEMYTNLTKAGKRVRFAIHPVAGRMPGQLNVLLAEAGVPYEAVVELEEGNDDMDAVDVAIVCGANDTVSLGTLDPDSPLCGMPMVEVWRAKQCVVVKRSLAAGYAGAENPLFTRPNTQMLLGDAKVIAEGLRDGVKGASG